MMLLFIAVLLLLISPVWALDVAFSADVSVPAITLLGTVYDSFGSSHGSTTLRARWREHFSRARDDIPFNRVRFHGILDDDLSTYYNGGPNGALVFDTLDFLVERGILPTIEIGFMPEALAANPSLTVFHYKGGASPPKNYADWRKFITSFVQLLLDRYGLDLVRTWRFEVVRSTSQWNEPNCGFFYQTGCCLGSCGNQTAYFKLYAETAAAVKNADASLLVGGPATAMLSWIPEFIAATRASGAPVDFVSSHLYPTDPLLNATDRESFMDAIASAANVAQSAGLPFLLTEFNAGLGNPAGDRVPVLDSSYAAAFVLHAHLRAQGIPGLTSMSWWTFTDFGFEEGGADPLPWHPGSTKFGIQTMYGVQKPVYRGLQLISDIQTQTAVPVTPTGGAVYKDLNGNVIGATASNVDVLVTTSADGVVTALISNFDVASSQAPQPPTANVTITFSGFSGALPKIASLELIDAQNTNPLAAWRNAGSPLYPNVSEIISEIEASLLIPEPLTLDSAGSGSVSVTVALLPYAVARVRFLASPIHKLKLRKHKSSHMEKRSVHK